MPLLLTILFSVIVEGEFICLSTCGLRKPVVIVVSIDTSITRTVVAPAIGIISVSVIGIGPGEETTLALFQTADDGATTFVGKFLP